MFNPSQDWPIYIFIATFFGALIYLIIIGHRTEKKGRQNKNSNKQ
jgi:hypothetical protein